LHWRGKKKTFGSNPPTNRRSCDQQTDNSSGSRNTTKTHNGTHSTETGPRPAKKANQLASKERKRNKPLQKQVASEIVQINRAECLKKIEVE
jgi:hypothetical protein